MTLLAIDCRCVTIKCKCTHIIRHSWRGNFLVKCYKCGRRGKLKKKGLELDIRLETGTAYERQLREVYIR